MTIRLLGTGTSQGIPVIGCDCDVCQSDDWRNRRLRTSVLIEVDGQTIVIDTGPDFRQQMLRADIRMVDAVLFTHEHNDHIIGLDDIRPYNFRSRKDMPVYAELRVQKEIKKRFGYIFDANPYPGAPMVVLKNIEDGRDFFINETRITPIRHLHGRLPILGFRINDFTYLTDIHTITASELAKAAGSRILVISALHRQPHHSHVNLEQALALIGQINPQVAYLTHLSHWMGLHEEVEAELPENVHLGSDNLLIET